MPLRRISLRTVTMPFPARLLYRKGETSRWTEILMQPLSNDRWRGEFEVTEIGDYFYTVQAWVDRFKSWRQAFAKKVDAGQDVALDLYGRINARVGARRQQVMTGQLEDFHKPCAPKTLLPSTNRSAGSFRRPG